MRLHLGAPGAADPDESAAAEKVDPAPCASGTLRGNLRRIKRLVQVSQKPTGRTPRSNLATYTGLFDPVRKPFAASPAATQRKFDAGRFLFNLPKGRCETCDVRDSSTSSSCSCRAPTRRARPARARAAAGIILRHRPRYLRLGQPATEPSGGEAQRIRLATELQQLQRGDTLYLHDEPMTGLHPADVDRLMAQLQLLVDADNTVVVAEHELRVIARCDRVIDMGPGGGASGGKVVGCGTPEALTTLPSRTGFYIGSVLPAR